MNITKGLFRLWIVATVMWVGIVGVGTYYVWPMETPDWAKDETPEWAKEPAKPGMFDDLIPAKPKVLSDAEFQNYGAPKAKVPTWGETKPLSDAEFDALVKAHKLTPVEGNPFAPTSAKGMFDDLPDAPWVVKHREEVRNTLFGAAAAAIMPSLAVLLLGMSLRWVVRGFRP